MRANALARSGANEARVEMVRRHGAAAREKFINSPAGRKLQAKNDMIKRARMAEQSRGNYPDIVSATETEQFDANMTEKIELIQQFRDDCVNADIDCKLQIRDDQLLLLDYNTLNNILTGIKEDRQSDKNKSLGAAQIMPPPPDVDDNFGADDPKLELDGGKKRRKSKRRRSTKRRSTKRRPTKRRPTKRRRHTKKRISTKRPIK